MNKRAPWKTPGFAVSGGVHALAFLFLIVNFAHPPTFEPPIETIPIEMITTSDLNQIMNGEKNAKQMPVAQRRVDKVAELEDHKDAAPTPDATKDTPPEPTPEKAIADPGKAEEKPPEPVAAVPPPPPAAPPAQAAPSPPAPPVEKVEASPPPEVTPSTPPERPMEKAEAPPPPEDKPPPPDAEPVLPAPPPRPKIEPPKHVEAKPKKDAKKPVPRPRPVKLAKVEPTPEPPPPPPPRPEPKKDKLFDKVASMLDRLKPDKPLDRMASLLDRLKPDPVKPQPPRPEPRPEPVKVEAPKPVERPKSGNEVKEAKPRDDFNPDKIAAMLSHEAPQRKASTGQALSQVASLGSPTAHAEKMSPSVAAQLDGWLIDHYRGCWSYFGLGATADYVPTIRIHMAQDGSLIGAPSIVNPPRDPNLKSLADSAIRAVNKCNPLPIPERFRPYYDQGYRQRVVRFDPKEMS